MFFRLANPAADPADWQPVQLLYGSQPSPGQVSSGQLGGGQPGGGQLGGGQFSGGQFSGGQLGGGEDHLDAMLASVRAALGGCEPRVAASLFFQG